MSRSDESNHGTTHTSPARICPSESSDVKMIDYIIHPRYQESKRDGHRIIEQPIHFKSLEEHLKDSDGERSSYNAIALTDLPAEVIENILSYLIAPLSCYTVDSRPRDKKELKVLNGLSKLRVVLERHPFYRLAATCHELRIAVETFANHLLHQYKKLLCFEIVEQDVDVEEWRKGVQKKSRHLKRLGLARDQKDGRIQVLPPYRLLWARWTYCRCLFCGRATKRHAIFNHSIWACAKCDKREWPKVKRKELLSDKSKCLLPIHLDSPHLAFPHHHPQLKQPLAAYDRQHGLFHLKSETDILASFVREHDPDGSISWAAQRKKNSTVVLKQFNGKTVELNASWQGASDPWSVLQVKGVLPKARLSGAVLEEELVPEWQTSLINRAIEMARALPSRDV
ncbi:hypothetical protein Vi05172_g8037 [Venturia inaequalis]|nr:hypothetical protein Vi05172_g8037 [Venturia inaequalis]